MTAAGCDTPSRAATPSASTRSRFEPRLAPRATLCRRSAAAGVAIGVLAVVTAASGAGCAPKSQPPVEEDLPAYAWVDKATALRDLRARAAAVKTVSAECTITLTRADGETVQLDGAMVTRNPGWVRLRAWKFNRAVFDLTLQPAGLWVMTLDDPKRREQVLPASVSASDFVRQWSQFNGDLFAGAGPDDVTVRGHTMEVAPGRSTKAGGALRCEVDRRTLTPRRYVYDDGRQAFEFVLDRYREVDGVPWPHRLVATGYMGVVLIEQRNVEINGELAPNAFVPPRRAEKRS